MLAVSAIVAVCEHEARAATNDEIIVLSRAKVGDEAILARIANEPCQYDLSVAQIGNLGKSGVSSRIIAAIIRKCGAEDNTSKSATIPDIPPNLRPGLYMVTSAPGSTQYVRLVPALISAGKAGGNGSLLFPNKYKLTLPGDYSGSLISSVKPEFWLVFGGHQAGSVEGASEDLNTIPGYEGLAIVRLKVRRGKRELLVGSAAVGIAASGMGRDGVVAAEISRKVGTIYVVSITEELAPGEYALIANAGANAYRVYDFSIR